MDIGEKIRNARIAKNMTQEEFGELLGIQKSAVAKYENGRVVNIKRSTLKKISDILDIPPYELIFEEFEEMQKNNDILADIIVRMRTDEEFSDVVKTLYGLDSDKLNGIKLILNTFAK